MTRAADEFYVQDRSVVCRFRPGGLCEMEFLQALPDEGAEPVYGPLATAHPFFTHADAERWGKEHRFQTPDGKCHTPWGRVLPGAEPLVRREELPTVTRPPRSRDERRGQRTIGQSDNRTIRILPHVHVEPSESFEILEKRGLA